MSLSTRINKKIMEDEDDVPEEIEHDLIKDSVLEIANTNFKISDDFDELPVGQIRRNLGEDLTAEYEGKPVSRKAFSNRNWMNDRTSNEPESDEDNGQLYNESDDSSLMNSGDEVSDGENISNEEVSDNEVEYMEGDEKQSRDSNGESELESDEEDNEKSGKSDGVMDINIFSSKIKNIEDDIKKGNSIKNQLLLWENLIECRIKFQKGFAASNRLMQKETFTEFKSQLSSEELSVFNSAYKGLIELLENFIQLRECLLKKCPEYVNFKKGSLNEPRKNTTDDNEEITSESENEKEEKESEEEQEQVDYTEPPPTKKRKTIKEFSNYLNTTHEEFEPFRDSVIQKWNDKTRLASGKIGISKFAILEQSTLKQIEQILLDRDRLLKRTQTKRSKLPILGKKNEEEVPKDEDQDDLPEQKSSKEDELDYEIFNDDDFYHKLLKDFIERKTSDVTDPTQLGRQWTKLQKLRSKMKKKVDTRATKGRKIRYTVHNKLVNFMAPIPYSTWDDKVEHDLFRSLFGQASKKSFLPD